MLYPLARGFRKAQLLAFLKYSLYFVIGQLAAAHFIYLMF